MNLHHRKWGGVVLLAAPERRGTMQAIFNTHLHVAP
jgi:hypothetical protein